MFNAYKSFLRLSPQYIHIHIQCIFRPVIHISAADGLLPGWLQTIYNQNVEYFSAIMGTKSYYYQTFSCPFVQLGIFSSETWQSKTLCMALLQAEVNQTGICLTISVPQECSGQSCIANIFLTL